MQREKTTMIKRLFIANRGEIAVRIIRACHELGIRALLPMHPVDRDSLAVKMADEAYPVLDRAPRELFLDAKFLVELAKSHNSCAIHPGYGFLSENPVFSSLCREAGLVFVGPPSLAQQTLGDKSSARRVMAKAGVPIVPGTEESSASLEEVKNVAKNIGYPLLLKAVRGGGGRGMRCVNNENDLESAFQSASREAQSAFGDGRIYIERYLERTRHVEIQIMGDAYGNIVHFGERECSIQRRYQKLIEEAPSPIVNESMRKEMGEAAVRGASAVGYEGAGTMEFLVDDDRNFYFLELNARIQVEHPVTELVTGFDLVKEQILIAFREPLSFKQEDVLMHGWAIECRINSEDPFKNFTPTPGKIKGIEWPGGHGIRVETGVLPGFEISTHYDSLVAKIIAWGRTREEARVKMLRALSECHIEGIETTIPFHKAVLSHQKFIDGDFSTHFFDEIEAFKMLPSKPPLLLQLAALAAALHSKHETYDDLYQSAYPDNKKNGGSVSNWKKAARLEAIGSGLRKSGVHK